MLDMLRSVGSHSVHWTVLENSRKDLVKGLDAWACTDLWVCTTNTGVQDASPTVFIYFIYFIYFLGCYFSAVDTSCASRSMGYGLLLRGYIR